MAATPPTPILGMSQVADYAAEQRPESWRDVILRKYSKDYAFTTLLDLLPHTKITDPKHHWEMQRERVSRIQAQSTITAGVTPLVVTAHVEKWVREDYLLLHETSGKVHRVSAKPIGGSGEIPIERAWGTTDATITSGDWLTVLMPVSKEGSDLPTALAMSPVDEYNYLSEPRVPWYCTKTELKTKFRGDPIAARTRRSADAWEEFMRGRERGFIFNPRKSGTTDGMGHRTHGGLRHYITTNIETTIGNITWSFINLKILALAKNGLSAEGGLIMGGLEALHHMQRAYEAATNGRVNNVPGEKTGGLDIKEFIVANRKMRLMENREMTLHPVFCQYAFVLDTLKLSRGVLEGCEVEETDNVQPRGKDALAGVIETKETLEVHFEESMAEWQGITGSTASA